MKRRLAKEIRQLAPWPVAAVVLLFTAGPFVHMEGRIALFPALYLLLAVFIPSARVFGAEFDQGTIDRLLAQPLARERIWREKLLALALTTGLAFGSLQLARALFLGPDLRAADLVMWLVALTGGPLVSLHVRQSFLGFLGAISLPAVPIWIWLFGLYLALGHFHVGFFWVHLPPVILYAPVAYVLGRRLFLSLELEQGSSRTIGVRGWLRVRPDASFGSTARLVLKELQIQSPNLLLVPATLVVWSLLCGMALSSPDSDWFGPLAVFAASPSALLTLIFPLLLGATAVAAERQMGIADWHASLPVSRARQWCVKLLVVTSLAVAGSILAGYLDRSLFGLLEARQLTVIPLAETTTGVWVLSAAVGVYASSRAREPFHALIGAVALLVWALLPSTSEAALRIRGGGLTSFLLPQSPGIELYLGVMFPTLALLAFAFASFRPEPWNWEKGFERVLRSMVLAGLLLTIGYW